MIKSMTAYARAETQTGNTSVSVEIRAYNSRFLDVVLRIPHSYLSMEEKIKPVVAKTVSRGRIELKFKISDESEDAVTFEVNAPRAVAYHKTLGRLKELLNIDTPIGLEQVAGIGDIIKPVEIQRDMDQIWQIIKGCLRRALDDLDEMRKREGEFIGSDITHRIDFVTQSLKLIKKDSTDLPAHYQERLKNRIAALTEGIVEIDPDRIAQEAAILADRSDITEEVVRAASHIRQFLKIVNSGEPAGRKLNFLLQELNREFNTIGSKTEKYTVSHLVVDVKSELEKIREQVQNVE